MAGVVVTATVSGQGSVQDLLDMIKDETDQDTELRVQHEAGACPPCKANDNPKLIPFPGCRGEERHAKARGYGCRCKAVRVRKKQGATGPDL